MSIPELLKYFGVERAWDIRWAHGVNSKERLERFLKTGSHFFEGDICRSDEGAIIMAHPPKRRSDLLFTQWLDELIEGGRGVKLDFKDPDIVEECLAYVQGKVSTVVPVIVNADIITGTGGVSQFDYNVFLGQCRTYLPTAILSPGWVSEHAPKARLINADFAASFVSLWPGDATFPARACSLRARWSALKRLIEQTGATMTVWNAAKHFEEVFGDGSLIQWMEQTLPKDRVFIDLVDADKNPTRPDAYT